MVFGLPFLTRACRCTKNVSLLREHNTEDGSKQLIPPSLRVKLLSGLFFFFPTDIWDRIGWGGEQRVVGCGGKLPQQRIECHCHKMHLHRCSQLYAMPMHQTKQSCYFPEGEKKKSKPFNVQRVWSYCWRTQGIQCCQTSLLRPLFLLKLSGQKSYEVVIQFSPK